MQPSSATESSASARNPNWKRIAAAAVAFAALGVSAASAQEQPTRVLVIGLTGSVPERPDSNHAFTRAVSRVAAVGGAEVIDAEASLADASALVGCAPDAEGCLDDIAEALGVEEILFGHVEPADDGGVTVSLTYHRIGDTREREFVVPAGSIAEQSRAVAREAASLLSGETVAPAPVEREPEPAPVPAPVVEPAPIVQPSPPRERDEPGLFGRVRTRSWIALGGGAVLTGTGAVFLALAGSRQGEIDDAPADTPEDFRRLVDLEDEADRYAMAGNVLAVAGGAILVTGVVLFVLDARSSPEDRGGTSIAIVPHEGGAGLSVSVELP
jgi:hypothetical protein